MVLTGVPPKRWELCSNRIAEVAYQLRGLLIAVRLG
jgi:hypothetical protein